ncbi:MAG TPA: hypothetical protein VLX91_09150 [Candidatus Acidoferrales bacterium]|nr:hypothetical protein [Candidatus Acidoferrales bacterium]
MEIQQRLLFDFGLDVPLYSLRTILTRAGRNGYVEKIKGEYKLKEPGNQLAVSISNEINEAKVSTGSLFDFLSTYMQSKGIKVSPKGIGEMLLDLIKSDLLMFEAYFANGGNEARSVIKNNEQQSARRTHDQILIEALSHVSTSEPDHNKVLESIVRGAVISLSLKSNEDVSTVMRRFKPTVLFLDSNFVFRMLELTHADLCQPVKELVGLLKSRKEFSLKVFDFTIEQMTLVLAAYPGHQHLYIKDVAVNSIYSSLRMRGWKTSTVLEYIRNLEELLLSYGVGVETTGIRLHSFSPADFSWQEGLRTFKSPKIPSDNSINHDLAAIERVARLRRHPKKRIEDSAFFFLSCDHRLAQFNLQYCQHHAMKTIAEVIPDSVLTNVLWLKDPKEIKRLDIHQVIGMFKRNSLIDNDVWVRFFDLLHELKDSGKVDDDLAFALLYDSHLREYLFGLGDPAKEAVVTYADLEPMIENAKRRRREAAIQHEATEKAKKLAEERAKHLTGKVEFLEPQSMELIEKNKQLIENLLSIKDTVRRECAAKARAISIEIAVLFWEVVVGVFLVLESKYGIQNLPSWIISVGLFALNVVFDRKCFKTVRNWLQEKFYRSSIKKYKLENISDQFMLDSNNSV